MVKGRACGSHSQPSAGSRKVTKSRDTYPAYSDTECEGCGLNIWEGDEIGFVDGEKVCERCWEEEE